jgi:hypothetical protein
MNDPPKLNLTPTPRVLRMLGQIDFKPWQCIAELVDNAVDAFLSARAEAADRGAAAALFPQVNIELSSAAEIRSGQAELRVSDNGPGMSQKFLEQAVTAGYSSNDSVDKLGLFGMGFNVATARLGGRTEVWTTRTGDEYWSGVRIDFDEMERSGSYLAPALRRAKTPAESTRHGTEIVVSKLDRERALYLRSGGGLKSTRDKLSRVYNKIMRDIGLEVVLVGTPLQSREFCGWGKNRYVDTKGEFGRVPAYLQIDEDLGERLYCDDCWVWLLEDESLCPVCGTSERLRSRQRAVHGWLGIQRFFEQVDYGIDLVRNGRVIEERSKVFFAWTNPDTDEAVPEYPLEQTHWGGRIIGELNIDFVPLASHQKDAFDKTSREWRQIEEVVRGKGPIIQKLRQQSGLVDRNVSPLARLHSGFRRGQPAGLRNLVPGDSTTGKGFNRQPQNWAGLFWSGDPDYQTDEKWYAAVLEAEEALSRKKGAAVPDSQTGADAFPDDEDAEEPDGSEAVETEPKPVEERTTEDTALSGVFELPEVPGSPTLEVTSQRLVTGKLQGSRPIDFAAVGSSVQFTYDPRHALFTQSLEEPVDCLVEELAYQFLLRSSATQTEFPLSDITARLRERYFSWTVSKFEFIRDEAEALLAEMIEFFTEALATLAPLSQESVSDDERRHIAEVVSRRDHAGDDRVREVIETGEYPRYLGPRCLPKLVQKWPELVLDGQFFTPIYTDVDESLQEAVLNQVVIPIRDLVWVANPDGAQAGGTEWRNMLGRSASSLRLLQAWKTA